MLTLQGPEQPVQALAFAPDSATLYAVGFGAAGVHVWNLADRTTAPLTVAGEGLCGMYEPHPGGRWAFAHSRHYGPPPGYNTARVIDHRAGTLSALNAIQGPPLAVSLDGGWVVTIGNSIHDDERPTSFPVPRLYGWAVTDAGVEYRWHRDTTRDPGAVHGVVALGPERFATAGHAFASPSAAPRVAVTVCHAADGSPEATIDFPNPSFHQLLAPRSGDRIVIRLGTSLSVWDARDLARPPVLVAGKEKPALNNARAACFDPSGRHLLLAGDAPSVLAYDTATWAVARKWNWKVGTLRAVAVSPDGTLAAAAGTRGTIVVWDLDL